jgi:hypothetical protein
LFSSLFVFFFFLSYMYAFKQYKSSVKPLVIHWLNLKSLTSTCICVRIFGQRLPVSSWSRWHQPNMFKSIHILQIQFNTLTNRAEQIEMSIIIKVHTVSIKIFRLLPRALMSPVFDINLFHFVQFFIPPPSPPSKESLEPPLYFVLQRVINLMSHQSTSKEFWVFTSLLPDHWFLVGFNNVHHH